MNSNASFTDIYMYNNRELNTVLNIPSNSVVKTLEDTLVKMRLKLTLWLRPWHGGMRWEVEGSVNRGNVPLQHKAECMKHVSSVVSVIIISYVT